MNDELFEKNSELVRLSEYVRDAGVRKTEADENISRNAEALKVEKARIEKEVVDFLGSLLDREEAVLSGYPGYIDSRIVTMKEHAGKTANHLKTTVFKSSHDNFITRYRDGLVSIEAGFYKNPKSGRYGVSVGLFGPEYDYKGRIAIDGSRDEKEKSEIRYESPGGNMYEFGEGFRHIEELKWLFDNKDVIRKSLDTSIKLAVDRELGEAKEKESRSEALIEDVKKPSTEAGENTVFVRAGVYLKLDDAEYKRWKEKYHDSEGLDAEDCERLLKEGSFSAVDSYIPEEVWESPGDYKNVSVEPIQRKIPGTQGKDRQGKAMSERTHRKIQEAMSWMRNLVVGQAEYASEIRPGDVQYDAARSVLRNVRNANVLLDQFEKTVERKWEASRKAVQAKKVRVETNDVSVSLYVYILAVFSFMLGAALSSEYKDKSVSEEMYKNDEISQDGMDY